MFQKYLLHLIKAFIITTITTVFIQFRLDIYFDISFIRLQFASLLNKFKIMNTAKITNTLLITIAVIVIFIYGKSLIVPFVIALIFWFLIKEIRNIIRRIPFIGNRISIIILNLFGFVFIFLIIGGIVKILALNIKELTTLIPVYQKNISILAHDISNKLNIDIILLTKEFLGEYEYSVLLSRLLNSLTDVFGKAVLIIIYTFFLLLEEPFFSVKIKKIYAKRSDSDDIYSIFHTIDRSIGRYISIKTLTSLITGLLSYSALLFIGIDAPLFWAFLIFVMNFIPTIGSLIATIFPTIFAMLQFGELMPGIWVLIVVGIIQLIIGNYIDPKLLGDSLNVSPLIVILGLSFWGAIWGIIGMILSVPISVMLITIFSQIPPTQSIAILLSKDGNIGGAKA